MDCSSYQFLNAAPAAAPAPVRPKRNDVVGLRRAAPGTSPRLCGVILSAHSCRPAATDSRGSYVRTGSSNAWFHVWSCWYSIRPDFTWSPRSDRRQPQRARGGARPDTILLHYTGMRDVRLPSACCARRRAEVSAHYVVSRTAIIQLGIKSGAPARKHVPGGETEQFSLIGIEIANPGHDHGYPDFPKRQIAAVTALCRAILTRTSSRPTTCSPIPTSHRPQAGSGREILQVPPIRHRAMGRAAPTCWRARSHAGRDHPAIKAAQRCSPIRLRRRRDGYLDHNPRRGHRLPAAFPAGEDRRLDRRLDLATLKALLAAHARVSPLAAR